MPTYDYECEKGHRFEAFQSMKDEPLSTCVECGAPVRRHIGPGAGFLFRGDGFYITDYRSKTYKEKAKSESGGGAGSGEGTKGGGASSGEGTKGGGTAPPSSGGAAKSEAAPGGAKDSAKPGTDKGPKKPPST